MALAIITSAALLSACGGGSDTTSASAPTFTPKPTTSAAEELAALNTINTARTHCGFGALGRNADLDTAALNHATWVIENNTIGHIEALGTAGFTGVDIAYRAWATWYPATQLDEVLTGGNGVAKTGLGARGVRDLLGAPYQLAEIMQDHSEIGISIKSGGPVGSGADIAVAGANVASWLVADLAASPTAPAQALTDTDVLTFPCQGTTNASTKIASETPSPVPARASNQLNIGQPILVQVMRWKQLIIASVSITGPGGLVALLPTMTQSSDPNALLQDNQAIIIPSAPLSPHTTYTVNITGANKGYVVAPGIIQFSSLDPGVPFSKEFTFTTGD